MSSKDVRAGIQQAQVGNFGIGILSLEAVVLAMMIGSRTSFAVGIFVFLGLLAAFNYIAASEKLAEGFAVFIGIVWAIAVFLFAQSVEASEGTAFALAVLALAIGGGGHALGFQCLRDLMKAEG